MAQRIEGKTVLVLDQAEFQAINRFLHGVYERPEVVDALTEIKGGDVLLDRRDCEVLVNLWGSIHNM